MSQALVYHISIIILHKITGINKSGARKNVQVYCYNTRKKSKVMLEIDSINLKKEYQVVVSKNVPPIFSNIISQLFIRDHPFKTSACLRGEGCPHVPKGQKVTVHKDQKSPS